MNSTIVAGFSELVKKLTIELTNSKREKNPSSKLLSIKLNATRRALQIIKDFPDPITNGEQLAPIKGIGPKFIKKMNEMIESGSISEAKSDTSSNEGQENYENVKALIRITGIGPVKAQKLVDDGITLDTLLTAYNSKDKDLLETLTHHQLLGVKHFHDLEKRIPRSEITEIKGFLEAMLKSINNDLSFIILGSYRREVVTSGDIDILVYHKGIHTLEQAESTTYLAEFKEILIQHNFLVDHLTMKGTTKYMGFGKYRDNPVRRIDIRFIALESLGAAMLYFTGSGEFNKNMRTFALKNGYTINEYGIYKLKSNRKTKDYIVPTETEEDIFKVLGLKYIEPHARTRYVKFQ